MRRLTVFLVAIVDTLKPDGKPLTKAAIVGGLLIIGAFLLLSWSSYREMNEERKKQYITALILKVPHIANFGFRIENEDVIVDDEDEDEEDVEGSSHLS